MKKKKEPKVLYKITKSYKGGSEEYYIKIKRSEMCEDLLSSIGENTEGGCCYGYRIKATRIRKLPKGKKLLPKSRTIDIY